MTTERAKLLLLQSEMADLADQIGQLAGAAQRLRDQINAVIQALPPAEPEKAPSGDPGEPQAQPKFGEVRYFATMAEVPKGWVLARGQAVKIDEYVMIRPELERDHPFVKLIQGLDSMILPSMSPDPVTGHLPHIYLGPRVARPKPFFVAGDVVRFGYGNTAFGIVRDINWHGGAGTYAYRLDHVLASIRQPIDVLESQASPITQAERDWLRLMGGLRQGVL